MKTTHVTVQWPHGLHARPAAKLVGLARRFRSRIRLRLGTRLADARSILHIIVLSAGLGMALVIEADGVDEQEAIQAVEEFFREPGALEDSGGGSFSEHA